MDSLRLHSKKKSSNVSGRSPCPHTFCLMKCQSMCKMTWLMWNKDIRAQTHPGTVPDFSPLSSVSCSHLRGLLRGVQVDWQLFGFLLHWSRWEWSPGAHAGVLQHDRWDHYAPHAVFFFSFFFSSSPLSLFLVSLSSDRKSSLLKITLHWSVLQ